MQKKTIVVKLGTSVLTGGTLNLDRAHMVELVRQCARLHEKGHDIILVTSGAVAAGREHLSIPDLPDTLSHKQMLASVGQSQLILAWEHLFNIYGRHVGQMLLTRADLEDRERYLNARDTLRTLLNYRIIPIFNENDAVATAEIKVGDNDNLSAMVATLAQADQLYLLTDQTGLFTDDPRKNPDAELIPEVKTIDETLRKLAGGTDNGLGTGGMATKLQAADVARHSGIDVVIAAGHTPDVITRLAEGETIGTRFPALQTRLESRKQWILAGPPPAGEITIDAGACLAVQKKGSSLLPKGITRVQGHFKRGEVVRIVNMEKTELARGIARYDSQEMQKIAGHHSEKIESILGYVYGSVAVHRDDLVLLEG
ncbi:glutamate 5-kinase [Algicola sagamiensis]|uniref:glutamate 5-kinase n=1 Tax=Algicola sagamiensis TaxID=163869 RepID=UPI0003615053|nr:glutamate 5-kinase [Algicola sagamiensis]